MSHRKEEGISGELVSKLFSLAIKPESIGENPLTEDEILALFRARDAVWLHGGDPKKPHAELTSGKCSNGYFNCSKILCFPSFAEILAWHLVYKLREQGIKPGTIDWVIGSPYAAITFSYKVAELLGAVHGFPEKDPTVVPTDPKGKRMLWKRWQIPKGAKVLRIEELITTLGTTMSVRQAVKRGNSEPVEFSSVVGTLVHRPPKLPISYAELRIVALVEKEVWAVEPSKCPLCKAGSKRLKPKSNWAELTGKEGG